jgi:hypothetical protein
MNSPQFDEYAVPADLADAVTTQDEDLGQTAGHHRRPTEPRFAQARRWVETVAVSAAMLTGLTLAITHGLPGSADRGAPVGEVATATPHSNWDVGTCVITRGWPAIDKHAAADRDSRHSGTHRTDLASCATEEQRAAQSAYLAQLLAQQASANARPAATRVRLG